MSNTYTTISEGPIQDMLLEYIGLLYECDELQSNHSLNLQNGLKLIYDNIIEQIEEFADIQTVHKRLKQTHTAYKRNNLKKRKELEKTLKEEEAKRKEAERKIAVLSDLLYSSKVQYEQDKIEKYQKDQLIQNILEQRTDSCYEYLKRTIEENIELKKKIK